MKGKGPGGDEVQSRISRRNSDRRAGGAWAFNPKDSEWNKISGVRACKCRIKVSLRDVSVMHQGHVFNPIALYYVRACQTTDHILLTGVCTCTK